VKDKQTKNNNLEFLIGWLDFPSPIHDTGDLYLICQGSELVTYAMIREFNKKWEQDYLFKTN
jgi:hypothetical protein